MEPERTLLTKFSGDTQISQNVEISQNVQISSDMQISQNVGIFPEYPVVDVWIPLLKGSCQKNRGKRQLVAFCLKANLLVKENCKKYLKVFLKVLRNLSSSWELKIPVK